MVTVNGHPVDVCQEVDGGKVFLSLGAGQAAEIRIDHGQFEPMAVSGRQDRVYKAKVFIRRSLSEFRDNYLDRSRFLSKSASSARHLFAGKSGRFPARW